MKPEAKPEWKPDQARLRELLNQVKAGVLAPDDAHGELLAALDAKLRAQNSSSAFEDLAQNGLQFARVDHQRAARQGFPEVIYCAGKTPAQVAQISAAIVARGSTLLATRADAATFQAVEQEVPGARYHEIARVIYATGANELKLPGTVGVLCAGTSDLPVAEEAAITLEVLGARVERFTDVGVAGVHRLLASLEEIRACRVLIVVAGMEGALPSVVGGLVEMPVIAVPTSVGYGASFGGVAALLGMLNSCASGISVVNIDNGFGAAMSAAKILKLIQTETNSK